MYIVIKEGEGYKVGVSNGINGLANTDIRDMLLEDNMPVLKLRGKKGRFVAFRGLKTGMQIMKYILPEYFGEDINDDTIHNIAYKMRQALGKLKFLDKDSAWGNKCLIIDGSRAYEISNEFVTRQVDNYIISEPFLDEIAEGSLEITKDKDATTRIAEAYKTIELAQNLKLFPLAIYDSTTGKRKIIK